MTVLQRPMSPVEAALIAEACTRSDVLWARAMVAPDQPQQRYRALWHVWHDDAVCVIGGAGEQVLPDLAGTAEVVCRSKDTGTQVIRFLARVEPVTAGRPGWDAAADALAAARLNTPDPQAQRAAWAASGRVVLLRPVTVIDAVAGDDRSPAGRRRAPEGPGTTLTRRPWHLGGRLRRARRQASGS
jgi:hypothetical protein